YAAILDGISYLLDVDRSKPDDMNILGQLAQIYSQKLGGSTEKIYYKRLVREQTPWREDPGRPAGTGQGRPTKLPPTLDKDGNLLPAFTRRTHERPNDWPAGDEWYDG